MCWFDYVDMTPEYKRAHFVEAYSVAFRAQYARRVDATIAPFINPIPGMKHQDPETLIHQKGKYNGINRGIQAADSISVPYPFYCSTALERATKGLWTHIPNIMQIATKDQVDMIKEEWDKHLANIIVLPDPRHVERYGIRFVAYLKKLVSLRERPWHLVRHLIQEGYISEDGAMMLFGEDIARQAQGLMRAEPI
jgi:hypothetical protein